MRAARRQLRETQFNGNRRWRNLVRAAKAVGPVKAIVAGHEYTGWGAVYALSGVTFNHSSDVKPIGTLTQNELGQTVTTFKFEG